MALTDDPRNIDTEVSNIEPYTLRRLLGANFAIIRNLLFGGAGVNGTFTASSGQTITVTNGIITEIVEP